MGGRLGGGLWSLGVGFGGRWRSLGGGWCRGAWGRRGGWRHDRDIVDGIVVTMAFLLRALVLLKDSIINAHGKPCAMALAQQTEFLF